MGIFSNLVSRQKYVSPYLGVYKPEINSLISIFQRISGVFLLLIGLLLHLVRGLHEEYIVKYVSYFFFRVVFFESNLLVFILLLWIIFFFILTGEW